jgi:hypothetical protein
LSLQQLVGGDGLPPIRLTAPALTDLPNGPGSTSSPVLFDLLDAMDCAAPDADLLFLLTTTLPTC